MGGKSPTVSAAVKMMENVIDFHPKICAENFILKENNINNSSISILSFYLAVSQAVAE